MKGCIYLIPVTLGSEDPAYVIPSGVLEITKRLRFFIVENTRSSRRFLRMIDKSFPIDDTTFMELNEHTGEKEMAGYLEPLMEGHDVGIMSEAGLPGLADPGARIVSMAHTLNIRVVPLSGPGFYRLSGRRLPGRTERSPLAIRLPRPLPFRTDPGKWGGRL